MVEIVYVEGETGLLAPIFAGKAVADAVSKLLVRAKLDGIAHVRPRLIEGHPKQAGQLALAPVGRVLVWVPKETSSEDLLTSLRVQIASGFGVALRVRREKRRNIGKAAKWLLRPPQLLRLETAAELAIVKATHEPSEEELTRLLECESQRELTRCIFGVGAGRTLVNNFRSKMTAWQRGRIEHGTVLSAEFDVWAFWAKLRAEHHTGGYLPMRFDTPLKVRLKSVATAVNTHNLGKLKCKLFFGRRSLHRLISLVRLNQTGQNSLTSVIAHLRIIAQQKVISKTLPLWMAASQD